MRISVLLVSTAMLAACGGGGGSGPQTVSSNGIAGSGSDTDRTTGDSHSFENPSKTVTYSAIGSSQHLEFGSKRSTTYNSNSIDTGSDALSVTYDRDDAEFELTFSDESASVDLESLYQDPGHRTDFGGSSGPQFGTPDLTGRAVFYIESGETDGNLVARTPTVDNPYLYELRGSAQSGFIDKTTFFYQKPGTTTKYVTYAGYLREEYNVRIDDADDTEHSWTQDRGALVFGEQTLVDDVPTSGSGSYRGEMLATMIVNDFDGDVVPGGTPNGDFQWIAGTSTFDVNFANGRFGLALEGEVFNPNGANSNSTVAPQAGSRQTDPNIVASLAPGSIFSASGQGFLDSVGTFGTFSGGFTAANFRDANGTPGDPSDDTTIFNIDLTDGYMSANTIDGSFFGPNGEEAGGAFRLSSGDPDARIDILGTFTGKK